MTDLKDALGTLDQLKVPDLRSDALTRRPGPMVEVGRDGSAARVRAGILAVVISIVAAAFAWSAFRPQSAPRDLVPGSRGAGGVPEIAATISVPRGTVDVAAGEGGVWSVGIGAVTRVDPISNAVVDTISVPSANGSSTIAAGNGGVWITNSGTRQLTKLDPATDQVVSIVTLPGAPVEVSTGDAGVWVTLAEDGPAMIVQIDPASGNAVGAPAEVTPGTQPIAFTPGSVVAADLRTPTVSLVPSSQAAAQSLSISTGQGPTAASPGNLWFLASSQSVFHVDTATSAVSSLQLSGIEQIAYGDGWLWAIQNPPSSSDTQYDPIPGTQTHLLQLDPSTGTSVNSLPLTGITGYHMAFGEGALWIGYGPSLTRIGLSS